MVKIGGSAKIRKIAVCGILSSGKSTVCKLLADLGAYVISADDIVHDLLLLDKPTVNEVVGAFGTSILSEKKINRKTLAEVVFSDPEKLKILESILHPKVVALIKQTYENVRNNNHYKAFVVEIPLMIRAGLTSFFDAVVLITADEKSRKDRSKKRGFTSLEDKKRLAQRDKEGELAKLADIIIQNNGSIEDLKGPIKSIL